MVGSPIISEIDTSIKSINRLRADLRRDIRLAAKYARQHPNPLIRERFAAALFELRGLERRDRGPR